jgi:ubiquinone biosynthesis monooxygenase Coq7
MSSRRWFEAMVDAVGQTIANILRVDHAGEYGAIRIYQGQQLLARWRAPGLAAFLSHATEDERRHRDAFEVLMRARAITPCNTLALWGVGGWLLGLLSGMLGRAAILVCTEAVEETVHRHLEQQVKWSADHDIGLSDTIRVIQSEELQHIQSAQALRTPVPRTGWLRLFRWWVATATESLIWLSTYGASSRMSRRISA